MEPCLQVATAHRPRGLGGWSPRRAPRPRDARWALSSVAMACPLARRARRGFFDDWAQWFEDFATRAELQEEPVEPTFRQRRGSLKEQEALITSRVWQGSGRIRRARAVLVDAGAKVQAFNVVVYPAYSQGLRPVLGVDVLSFRCRRHAFGPSFTIFLSSLSL